MIGLNRPIWPLLLVFLSPLVTLPITGIVISSLPECGNDLPWWQVGHLRLALLPGVVDLVPFVWLLSAKSRVKHAAAIAGVIGVARVALPQLTLGFIAARYGPPEGTTFGPSAGDYLGRDPSCFVSPFMLAPVILLMLGIFAVSALFCVFLIRRANPRPPQSFQQIHLSTFV